MKASFGTKCALSLTFVALAGCQAAPDVQQPAMVSPTTRVADGLTADATAEPGRDLEPALLAAGFDKAIEQAVDKGKPVCLSYSVDGSRKLDPPEALRSEIARRLSVAAFPGSDCGFEERPFVKASREIAMLYTVKFTQERQGSWLIEATAVYGNLGANGQAYRLQRSGGSWLAEPTGVSWIS